MVWTLFFIMVTNIIDGVAIANEVKGSVTMQVGLD